MSAELNEAKRIYSSLIEDYKTFQDIARIRKKYVKYMGLSGILFLIFAGFYLFFYNNWIISLSSMLLFLLFLAIFVIVASKGNKYILSSNERVFLDLCTGYRKLEAYVERGSELYLEDGFKAVNRAYRKIVLGKKGESSWDFPIRFYEELGILGETLRRKILANISIKASNEQMQKILLEIMKLANIMRNPSTEKIEEFVEVLRENKTLPEREYITFSRRMIRALQQNRIVWGLLKGLGLFGLSALIVVGFGWLLCEVFAWNLGDYVGYLIVGTITLFVALLFKRE